VYTIFSELSDLDTSQPNFEFRGSFSTVQGYITTIDELPETHFLPQIRKAAPTVVVVPTYNLVFICVRLFRDAVVDNDDPIHCLDLAYIRA